MIELGKKKEEVKEKMDLQFDLAKTRELMKVFPLNKNEFGFYLWTFRISKGAIRTKGIFQHNVKRLLEILGYRKITATNQLVVMTDGIIEEVSVLQIKNRILALIDEMDKEIEIEEFQPAILKEELIEIFFNRNHNVINESNSILDYLQGLEQPILKDQPHAAFLCYQNTIVEVTSKDIKLIDYKTVNGLIWKHQIIQRDFDFIDYSSSSYQKFIFNICDGLSEKVNTLRSILGYNLYRHNPETESRATYLLDAISKIALDPMGGTGKGLLVTSIGHIVVVQIIDAKRFNGNNRFLFQEISTSTDVVHLDDARSNFNPDTLNSVLSSGLVIERKGKNPIRIAKVDSPKFIISSNSGVQSGGTTRQRRQVFFTLGSFYSDLTEQGIKKPIRHVHGHDFFGSEWTQNDWLMFDNFMVDSLQLFLCKGIIELKDDTIKWINLRSKTGLEFCEFVKELIPEKEYDTKNVFNEFQNRYGLSDKEMSQRKFSNCLSSYAKLFGFNYEVEASNGTSRFRIKN